MNMYKNIIKITKKNFGMTPQEFKLLCSKLSEGENDLFEKIYLSHFGECQQYLSNQHRISMDESYDLTMDTLINFRKGLIAGKIQYGNLRFLFTRMAYYLHLKKKKKLDLLDKEEYQHLIDISDQEDVSLKESRINQIQTAITKLSEDKQKFLEMHFFKKLKLIEIADLTGKSGPTTRKRKQRILDEIKSILNLQS